MSGFPEGLSRIVAKMMAREVENRYSQVAKVLADLEKLSVDLNPKIPSIQNSETEHSSVIVGAPVGFGLFEFPVDPLVGPAQLEAAVEKTVENPSVVFDHGLREAPLSGEVGD